MSISSFGLFVIKSCPNDSCLCYFQICVMPNSMVVTIYLNSTSATDPSQLSYRQHLRTEKKKLNRRLTFIYSVHSRTSSTKARWRSRACDTSISVFNVLYNVTKSEIIDKRLCQWPRSYFESAGRGGGWLKVGGGMGWKYLFLSNSLQD